MTKKDTKNILLTTEEISAVHEILGWYLEELKKTTIDKNKVVCCEDDCEEDKEQAFEQQKQWLNESIQKTKELLGKFT